MQNNIFRFIIVILAMAISIKSIAQDKSAAKKIRHSSNIITRSDGKEKATISTSYDGKVYRLEMIDDKITELLVDGNKIPESNYRDYDKVINEIKEQVKQDRIQAKKDLEKAVIDQQHAKVDQDQALKDQVQAKKDQEQAERDQKHMFEDKAQAEKNALQYRKDKEQAEKDALQYSKDKEQAEKDQLRAKTDQEGSLKDQSQAKKDQEQSLKDQILAKKDQEQALEDQKLLKGLMEDLVKDGIVANEESISGITLNAEEMTINEKKQPADVYNRYKEKYKRFSTGNFSYGKHAGFRGIHMERESMKKD